jgi:hypothetical protein
MAGTPYWCRIQDEWRGLVPTSRRGRPQTIFPGLLPVFRSISSVFNDEKKLSISALSQMLPDRLMLQTMPLSAIVQRKEPR